MIKKKVMKKIFYFLALLLSITWVLGFFILGAGMFIHGVLLIAILLYLQGIICAPKMQERIGGAQASCN